MDRVGREHDLEDAAGGRRPSIGDSGGRNGWVASILRFWVRARATEAHLDHESPRVGDGRSGYDAAAAVGRLGRRPRRASPTMPQPARTTTPASANVLRDGRPSAPDRPVGHHPGGHENGRPPMRWKWRWSTVWPPHAPDVGDDPVAALGDPLRPGDRGRDGEEVAGELGVARRSARPPRRCGRAGRPGCGSVPAERCRGRR